MVKCGKKKKRTVQSTFHKSKSIQYEVLPFTPRLCPSYILLVYKMIEILDAIPLKWYNVRWAMLSGVPIIV